jgi:hypothetical protein
MIICKLKNFPGLYPRTPVNRGREKGGRKTGGEEKGRRRREG